MPPARAANASAVEEEMVHADAALALWIGNERADCQRTFAAVDPATGEPWMQVPEATKALVDDAIASAVAAQPLWYETSVEERAARLREAADRIEAHADELALALTRDQGKPLKPAKGEVIACAMTIRRVAERTVPEERVEGKTLIETCVHRPLGCVAAIVPWNFPVIMSTLKWSRALFYGNSCIVKPSPHTSVCDLMIARLLAGDGNAAEAVFPPGVLTFLSSSDDGSFDADPPNLGAYLTSHPSIRGISFTGSTQTGKSIIANSALDVKRLVLEMGGNGAALTALSPALSLHGAQPILTPWPNPPPTLQILRLSARTATRRPLPEMCIVRQSQTLARFVSRSSVCTSTRTSTTTLSTLFARRRGPPRLRWGTEWLMASNTGRSTTRRSSLA